MEKIAVITDSCADLRIEDREKYDIFVIPLKLTFSDGTYYDGLDITADEVYRRLPVDLPKTSLPDGDIILKTFDAVRDKGYTCAVAPILSSGLSGTYQLIKMLAEEYTDVEIKVFDSNSGSLGTGAVAIHAARLIQAGRTFEQMQDIVPRLCRNTTVYFSVNTLEYLKKGGRIGMIAAVAGSMLGIKPIISFAPNGQLVSVAKVRGRAAAMKKLVELAKNQIEPNKAYNIMWAHGGCLAEGEQVRDLLQAAAPEYRSVYSGEIDGTLASYVGPELLGAAAQVLDDDMILE